MLELREWAGLDERVEDIPIPTMLDVLGVRRPVMIPVAGEGTKEFLDPDRVASEGRVEVGGSGNGCDGGLTIGAEDKRRVCDKSS